MPVTPQTRTCRRVLGFHHPPVGAFDRYNLDNMTCGWCYQRANSWVRRIGTSKKWSACCDPSSCRAVCWRWGGAPYHIGIGPQWEWGWRKWSVVRPNHTNGSDEISGIRMPRIHWFQTNRMDQWWGVGWEATPLILNNSLHNYGVYDDHLHPPDHGYHTGPSDHGPALTTRNCLLSKEILLLSKEIPLLSKEILLFSRESLLFSREISYSQCILFIIKGNPSFQEKSFILKRNTLLLKETSLF